MTKKFSITYDFEGGRSLEEVIAEFEVREGISEVILLGREGGVRRISLA